jgi:hypothetical protein
VLLQGPLVRWQYPPLQNASSQSKTTTVYSVRILGVSDRWNVESERANLGLRCTAVCLTIVLLASGAGAGKERGGAGSETRQRLWEPDFAPGDEIANTTVPNKPHINRSSGARLLILPQTALVPPILFRPLLARCRDAGRDARWALPQALGVGEPPLPLHGPPQCTGHVVQHRQLVAARSSSGQQQ